MSQIINLQLPILKNVLVFTNGYLAITIFQLRGETEFVLLYRFTLLFCCYFSSYFVLLLELLLNIEMIYAVTTQICIALNQPEKSSILFKSGIIFCQAFSTQFKFAFVAA